MKGLIVIYEASFSTFAARWRVSIGHDLVLGFAATRGGADTRLLRFEAENDEIMEITV